ncbi:unnamed protein product [Sphagnum balticum]
MNKESMDLISENLDKLPLTTRGILQLSCYPVDVVRWLLTKKVNTQANDIFSYLMGTAKKHTMSLGLPAVDFSRAEQMAIAMNVHHDPYIDADLLEELKQNQQREAIKRPHNAKGWAKQFAGSLGSPAPEPDFSEHRNWENEQNVLR